MSSNSESKLPPRRSTKSASKPKPRKMDKEKEREEDEQDPSLDPLGKPIAEFSSTKQSVSLMIGAVVVVGLGIFLILKDTKDEMHLFFGGLAILVALVMAGWGFTQAGKKLEVRRKGIRYTKGRTKIQMRWKDISDIQIVKTYVGSQGSTNIEWDITINGKKTIHLPNRFLSLVPDKGSLIHLMKINSGIDPVESEG